MSRARAGRNVSRRGLIVVAAITILINGLVVGGVAAQEGIGSDEAVVIEVTVADRAELDRLIGLGVDLDHVVEPSVDGYVVHAVVTGEEIDGLHAEGFATGRVLWREGDGRRHQAERDAERAADQAEAADAVAQLQAQVTAADPDPVVVMRADYYTTGPTEEILYVEARSALGGLSTTTLQVCYDAGPGTAIGDGGCINLQRFTDAGQYMYHQRALSVAALANPPTRVRVTSSAGGSAEADVHVWLPTDPLPPRRDPYASDFISDYMTPTELYAAYDALAAEFPDLVQVIDLPYDTNGYRRKAQALFGATSPSSAQASVVVVSSVAYGSEGGNDLRVELRDPGAADAPLSITVNGNDIVVSLATDSGGALTSTAAQVVAALNASASALVHAFTYRGNAGAGIVAAAAARQLTDFLSAPAAVSRDPFPVRAYRIGKPGPGKIGVLAYAQEHAREWVPPLVALETANRLVRNYAQDGATKQLLNKVDVFMIPSVNPDGGHYAFYDDNGQRRNMTNHCPDSASDPNRRDSWGVDNNRNYDFGSIFDGYSGASSSCLSDTFSGPAELSEPESHNVTWLADAFPSIRFSMNLHSSGNYFMWSPGAYSLPGRITLPRPSVGEEAFFWASSNRMLSEIKRYRNLAVTPARTGPICDVLYSAAGNSGDRLWYVNDIFAWNFEVGGAGFQPSWDEAHAQTMEFANGLMELIQIAYDYGKDHQRPDTKIQVVDNGDGTAAVTFNRTEPVTVFYTLDGSRPTFTSLQIQSAGIRLLDETLTVPDETWIKWFAIDSAGNIEDNYNPAGSASNFNKAFVDVAG
jgi:hypothetical protein